MFIFRKQLEDDLGAATTDARSWFASRCVLRALPMLVKSCEEGVPFWYWKVNPKMHLHAVFLAVDHALSPAYSNASVKPFSIEIYAANTRDAASAAYAANVVNAAVNAAEAASSAAKAAVTAYAAYAAALASATATKAAGVASGAEVERAIATDWESLRENEEFVNWAAPLWPDGWPSTAEALRSSLSASLRGIGLGYWAHEFGCWIQSEFDITRRQRREQLTDVIIRAGGDAIQTFLEADQTTRLAEARVIFIGDGGAGKTSVIRCLHDEPLQPSEPPTPGVNVREEIETVGSDKVRVHFWDFGGQVFLHGTHQLFLRERCVNIVVLKARESGEREMAEYWLEHVRVFGGESPTLIVQNQVDTLAKGMATPMPFDTAAIRRRYPFVNECINLSCETSEGLHALRKAVAAALSDRRILDQQTLPSWFKLKESLREELTKSAHIDHARFNALCVAAGIPKEENQRTAALAVMDQLGVALHFQTVDPSWFILDPSWLTGTVYHLLWRANEEDMRGTLTEEMLRAIFDRKLCPTAPEVPPDKFGSLLKLLVCFGLAYEHQPGYFRVPMLAPDQEPELRLPETSSTGFVVRMIALLPPLVFHRFVALCGPENSGDLLWRNGCVLAAGGATAVVRMARLEREIRIEVWGEPDERGRYQTVLRQRLQRLLSEDVAYQNLEYTPQFIQNGREYDWRAALGAFSDNQKTVYDSRSGRPTPLRELMEAAFGLGQLSMELVLQERRLVDREWHETARALLEHSHPPVHVEVNPTITVSPDISVENNQTLSISVTVETLVKLDGCLDELAYEIRRLKRQDEDIENVREDIAEIRKLIVEYEANRDTGPKAEVKRTSLVDRIKRMGGRVLQAVASIDNLTTIAVNVQHLLDALKGAE